MLRNCLRCDRLFAHPVSRLCQTCAEQDDAKFKQVKELVRRNPMINIVEARRVTQIDSATLIRFANDHRIAARAANAPAKPQAQETADTSNPQGNTPARPSATRVVPPTSRRRAWNRSAERRLRYRAAAYR